MPPPSKKARLAQEQRAEGSRSFGSGLLNDIEDLCIDPSYVPSVEDNDSDEDSDTPLEPELIFEDSDTEIGEEEVEDVVRKAKIFWTTLLDRVSSSYQSIVVYVNICSISEACTWGSCKATKSNADVLRDIKSDGSKTPAEAAQGFRGVLSS